MYRSPGFIAFVILIVPPPAPENIVVSRTRHIIVRTLGLLELALVHRFVSQECGVILILKIWAIVEGRVESLLLLYHQARHLVGQEIERFGIEVDEVRIREHGFLIGTCGGVTEEIFAVILVVQNRSEDGVHTVHLHRSRICREIQSHATIVDGRITRRAYRRRATPIKFAEVPTVHKSGRLLRLRDGAMVVVGR